MAQPQDITVFGAGVLWGTRISATGTPTPVKFGILQDVSIDISFSLKELYGNLQFSVASGRGHAKASGKAKLAGINAALMNELFFGQTLAVGSTKTINDEVASIPATPFTVTVVNAATFKTDLGVYYSLTGVPLTKVAATPTVGQYSVSNLGVYTFAAADTLLAVKISYTYTAAAVGESIDVMNQLVGVTPYFSLVFTDSLSQITYEIPKCTSSKMTFQTKIEDFTIPDFDFTIVADASGKIWTQSFSK